MNRGPLIILSGPAGSGKSTLVRDLLAAGDLRLRRSISATTRPPRYNEVDGRDYHFWSRERFEQEIAAGRFLEWADVFGELYGTPSSEVEPYRGRGVGVVLVIDVQGAATVRQKCAEAVSIFLHAPAMEDYEQRMRRRHSESEETLQRRLAGARREVARAGEYYYQVVNDDLGRAVAQVREIIQGLFREDQECSTI